MIKLYLIKEKAHNYEALKHNLISEFSPRIMDQISSLEVMQKLLV